MPELDSAFNLAWDNFSKFTKVHLNAPAGTSALTLKVDRSLYDYSQLFNPATFVWKAGITPFSDLSTIRLTWVIYFTTIMFLKFMMRNREPFKMKYMTALHSLSLCIASLGMFIMGLVGAYEIFLQNGDIGDIFLFQKEDTPRKGMMYYSLYIYYLSKFPELLDTVILVLKKKNVIFLHWYHHAIVILMVWSWLESGMGLVIFGLLFNTAVHVCMYWYYFASVLGWNVWFKKYITTMQIVQFVCSFLVTGIFLHYAFQREYNNWYFVYFTTSVNFSFLLLFVQFYLTNYKSKKNVSKPKVESEKKIKDDEGWMNEPKENTPKGKKSPSKKRNK